MRAILVDAAPSKKEFQPLALWSAWVAANALGEALGLGAIALLASLLAPQLAALPPLPSLLLMLALGAFEGCAVGVAQAAVLRRPVPALRVGTWVVATVLGALAAWLLGMLPRTIMHLAAASDAAGAPPPQLGATTKLLLAAALGGVAGPVLALFQWRVLRRHLAGAGLWMLVHALAWMAGMPLIFRTVRQVVLHPGAAAALQGVLLLAAAGAVVGAIHGVGLLWLLRRGSARP